MRHQIRGLLAGVTALSLVVFLAPPAHAATVTWDGGAGDNNWSTAANWVGDAIPLASDHVVVPSTGQSLSNADLGVNLASVTLDDGALGFSVRISGALSLTSGGFITNDNSATGGAADNVIFATVALNGPATFTQGATAGRDLDFDAAISGTGPLTITNNDTSILIVEATNSYTGATTVTGTGQVRFFLNGSVPTGSALAVNGNVRFDTSSTVGSLAGSGTVSMFDGEILTVGGNNSSTTFSGVYEGLSGGTTGLIKTGTGTLELTGNNTYTGGTTVSNGSLHGTTSSIQGNIVNNANVTFNQGSNGTYSGAMSGTGQLTKLSTGIITLSGANTYTGGTDLVDGTLKGTTTSLQGNIANNSLVIFDQGSNGTYSGVISGVGNLAKEGAGTVTLSGSNTYNGPTTVIAGRLSVTGSSASATTASSGGTLMGTGTITGTATINSGGTLAPGTSVGTLSTGALSLSSGSTYSVEIDGSGSDRTNVTGTVSPGNATLIPVPGGGYTHTPGTVFTIISNDGTDAVTGTFDGLPEGGTVATADHRFEISYVGGTGNDVTLRALQQPAPNIPVETLTVTKIGDGSGVISSDPAGINCGDFCSYPFMRGSTVTLTATPDDDSEFAGWTGACSGTENTCTVTMSDSKSVEAQFALAPVTLDVVKKGTGRGRVTSDPAGIACGATCSRDFDAGTIVTLQATARRNSTFVGWRGACSGAEAVCSVELDEDTVVRAKFVPTLTLLFDQGRFRGRVAANKPRCLRNRDVIVKKKRPGRDRRVARAETNRQGRWWSNRVAKAHGRFYGVLKKTSRCSGARSNTLALPQPQNPRQLSD